MIVAVEFVAHGPVSIEYDHGLITLDDYRSLYAICLILVARPSRPWRTS